MANTLELLIKAKDLASDKINKVTKNFKKIEADLKNMAKAAAIFNGALAVSITRATTFGDTFDKMSKRLGASAKDLSALRFAVEQSGGQIEQMEGALRTLNRNMSETAKGTGVAKDFFKALGVEVAGADGKLRSNINVVKDIADRIAVMEDKTQAAVLAGRLLGEEYGPRMVPLLSNGSEGIEKLMERAKELGIVIDGDAAKASADFADKFDELQKSLDGVIIKLGSAFIPLLEPMIKSITSTVIGVQTWIKENRGLFNGLIKLAAVLAGAGGIVLSFTAIAAILPSVISGLKLLKLAFISTPWGLVLTAAAGIALAFASGADSVEDFKNSIIGLKNEALEEKLDELNKQLEVMSLKEDKLRGKTQSSNKVEAETARARIRAIHEEKQALLEKAELINNAMQQNDDQANKFAENAKTMRETLKGLMQAQTTKTEQTKTEIDEETAKKLEAFHSEQDLKRTEQEIDAHLRELKKEQDEEDKEKELKKQEFRRSTTELGGDVAKEALSIGAMLSKRDGAAFKAFASSKAAISFGLALMRAAESAEPITVALRTALATAAFTKSMAMISGAKFHEGGLVGGAGEVPAVLQQGEFVVRRSAVQQIGAENLQNINQGISPNVTIANFFDTDALDEYLSSDKGKGAIINAMSFG